MTPPDWITSLVVLAVVVTGLYTLTFFAFVSVMLGLAIREGAYRRRQRRVHDYEALLESAYTIPVSIVAPVYNERVMAVPAVRSLLAMRYPALEVIVVDDGSKDDTLAKLIEAFELEPVQAFFRASLPTATVRTVFRSRTEPALTVVSKANGGKADAMNCGVNFSHYRYVCCVDGDTVFSPDAILKAMALVVKDPGLIVAVGSMFGIHLTPESGTSLSHLNQHALSDFQHMDMMRSFVAYRMAWSRINSMLCVPGAFGLWRRDLVLEMGGFSSEFTCEDIEMTFRLHEKLRRERRPYRILSLPEMVGQTEGPSGIRNLVRQRARWQRVTMETVWHYRKMIGRRAYGAVGLVGLPYYLLFEVLAPIVQTVAILTLIAVIVFGFLNWQAYVAMLGMMLFATALPTTVAVSLHDRSFRDYRLRDLIRMLALGVLDLIFYRPIVAYAGVVGVFEFLLGKKDWNHSARNARSVVA